MEHFIIVDKEALREMVESNIYQSRQFSAGIALSNSLVGDESVDKISPRVHATWEKGNLYLLLSRSVSSYMVVDAAIFKFLENTDFTREKSKGDVLTVFQRVCRFALKDWNGLGFSYSEMWSPTTHCGVVFPFAKSKTTGYRVSIKYPKLEQRTITRHGDQHLFCFAAGETEKVEESAEQARQYKRAFEELTGIRAKLDSEIALRAAKPEDHGFRPLILTEQHQEKIWFQSFENWMSRLTISQMEFVQFPDDKPQRVEGPAGTGKTLCLILRAFFLCKLAEEAKAEFRIVFVTHSEATKDSLDAAFEALGEPHYHRNNPESDLQFIEVCTLQEWCGKLLGKKEIASTQFLDQDALSAKEMRRLILKDLVERHRTGEGEKFLDYLSESCKSFFLSENSEYIAELLQHEIGIMIKGRASEKIDSYINLPRLTYGIPVESDDDKKFIFKIYKDYQDELNQSGVFDTDDIVLTALGRLNTPIWRRRRTTEGYHAVIIDETHLFNFNELALFHHLLANPSRPQIIFSIDRSQAPGDRGLTSQLVKEFLVQENDEESIRTDVVFRCSPQIVKLAAAITRSGATLFTNFENPLTDVSSVISATDEKDADEPILWECGNDESMVKLAIERAKTLTKEKGWKRSDILIIATTEELLGRLRIALEEKNTPHHEIAHRGDIGAVTQGIKSGAFLISHPDFVGGLEFKFVILLGVDQGRLPPTEGIVREESKHFVEFKACNRLYVAVTRARLQVEMMFSTERGSSELIKHALDCDAITLRLNESA